MSGLALALHRAGRRVSGSDIRPSPSIDELRAAGIPVRLEQAGLPEAPGLVVRTAAMPEGHPEIRAASALGIPVIKRAELLGRLCRCESSAAGAGTHGKTTICAMLAWLLHRRVPGSGWFVGGRIAGLPSVELGAGRIRACEADEFDRSFLRLSPTHLVLGRIDWDHVDVYPTPERMYDSFDRLTGSLRGDSPVIQQVASATRDGLPSRTTGMPGGDAYTPRCCIEGTRPLLRVGEREDCEIRVIPREGPTNRAEFVILGAAGDFARPATLPLEIPLPGRFNLLNAATALAWHLCGGWREEPDPGATARALSEFPGLERRFQLISSRGRRRLYDDYAHHPSEIAAFIEGARGLAPGRLTLIHQPHTYSRGRAFAAEIGAALSAADRVFLWPVFAAREEPLPGVPHRSILPHVHSAEVCAVDGWEELAARLGEPVEDELVATVGAGDLYLYHDRLKTWLSGR